MPFEVAAHHFVHAFMGLIEWWLEHDMPFDPERMGTIYRDLIHRPLEATALRPRTPP